MYVLSYSVALINQFMRVANVYFLIIAILQSIPQISPLSVYTAWIPLIVVLAISMFREGKIKITKECKIFQDADKIIELISIQKQR